MPRFGFWIFQYNALDFKTWQNIKKYQWIVSDCFSWFLLIPECMSNNLKRKNTGLLNSNNAKRVCRENQLVFCMLCGEYSFLTDENNVEKRHKCTGKSVDPNKVKKCINILKSVIPPTAPTPPPPPPPPPPPHPPVLIPKQKPNPRIMAKTSQRDGLFNELRTVLRYG